MAQVSNLQPGDRSQAICDTCKAIVETVIERRDVPLSNGGGIAREALAAICTDCDKVVAMPAQDLDIIRSS